MDGHQLGAVGKGRLDLDFRDHLRHAVHHLVAGEDRRAIAHQVGDRPIQVGSHYHFFETNGALRFERGPARGMRLDIAAGTAVRFEPGQERDVTLIPLRGKREVYGFQQKIMGAL